MEVSTKNNAEGKVSSVNEEVCRNQGSKGNEETTAVGDVRHSGMEGALVVCEHVEEVGERTGPRESLSTSAERKSSDTCGFRGGRRFTYQISKGLKRCGRDGGTELHPECSQRAAMGLAHVRQQMQ